MAVETAADRAVFVDPDDFGVAAIYRPITGGSSTVNGIFDSGYFDVDVEAGVAVASAQLRFTARTADIPEVEQGDELEIAGDSYIVRNVQADGTGMTACILEEE